MEIKNKKIGLLFILLFNTCAFGLNNGTELNKNQEQSIIETNGCTGTVLSGSWVLTANHCNQKNLNQVYSYNNKKSALIKNHYILDYNKNGEPLDITLWELNKKLNYNKITKINLNNSIKSNNIIIKGYGGNNKRLTKGTMYLSEIKDDHVYLLKKDGSYTIGGDSGAPYFNDKNELIAVHNGILGNKEKMFGTTIESIKNVLLEKINNWNYPTEVEIEDSGIVEIQNLSLDNKVDESYIEGDIEIIQSKSTCNNEIIEPYKTCYYFVKTNGNYGKINIDNNNFIEINKNKKINDEIKEPIEKSENKKSGGAINYLSLIFLLLFIKRKKHI